MSNYAFTAANWIRILDSYGNMYGSATIIAGIISKTDKKSDDWIIIYDQAARCIPFQ